MTGSYRDAVLSGSKAAARLHISLGLREIHEEEAKAIDIFDVIARLDIPVLVRPLEGLLGAFLNEPQPGILVTTKRDRKIQRLTAAHELGHYIMKHTPSLDDDGMLRRSVVRSPSSAQYMEYEADAFAFAFLMPRWLISSICKRYHWNKQNLLDPITVYQLSLRVGVSYEAICRTMNRYQILSTEELNHLLSKPRKAIKQELLKGVELENYRGDVWRISELDSGLSISGDPSDAIVFDLEEHAGSGYRWHLEDISQHGFEVLADTRYSNNQEQVGSPCARHIVSQKRHADEGTIEIAEARPWQRDQEINGVKLYYDWHGTEQSGLPRAAKMRLLEP